MPIRLIFVSRNQEKVIEIEKPEISLGRSSENDVEIEDINSSRYHCQIKKNSDGSYYVVDLKSRNGTFINGMLVDKKVLQPGDKIEIGQSTFYFERIQNLQAEETARLPALSAHLAAHLDGKILKRGDQSENNVEDLEREVQDLCRLLEINRGLTQETRSKKILTLIMGGAVEVGQADRGFLVVAQGDELEIKGLRNLNQKWAKQARTSLPTSIVSEVMDTGQPILTNDGQNDDRFIRIFDVEDLKLRSLLCVPLRVKKGVLGCICLDKPLSEGVFNKKDLFMVQAFADQAAIALQMVKLLEEKKRRERELEQAKENVDQLNQQLADELEKQKLRLEAIKVGSKQKIAKIKKRPKFKGDYSHIITNSPKMFEIFRILDRVVNSNVPVLIQGQSGTGKELIARALHFNSHRKKNPFVSENCGAIPQNLMESEFFGYEKGAFTGADKSKMGLFEVAHESTLFLDEISEMSPDIQTKLLRVLQEGEIRRVGGKSIIKVQVRVVSACNKDLAKEVEKHNFREDLFYRLNVITIDLPPLRERKEDIPLLIPYFLEKANQKSQGVERKISPEAIEILLHYNWPGNIRELENEMERAVALSQEIITPDYFSESILSGRDRGPLSSLSGPSYRGTLKEILQREVEKIEKKAILEVLARTNWKKSEAAQQLGISRPTLDTKIDKYCLQREV